jgi:hypothetical protein
VQRGGAQQCCQADTLKGAVRSDSITDSCLVHGAAAQCVCVCVSLCVAVFVCNRAVARQHPHNARRRWDPWVQMLLLLLLLLLCGAGIADPLLPSPTHTHTRIAMP